MEDRFGRRIDYLRISLTDLCNFRCRYCMPPGGVEKKKREDILSLEEIYYITHIFVEGGVRKVRLTGGEPLVRKDIQNLIESLSRIEGIEDLAMTTNGSLLKGRAEGLKEAGLDRVNISLDTLNPETFSNLTGGGRVDEVLEGIDQALRVGLGVKLNAVLLKGICQEEIEELVKFSLDKGVDLRFIEVMPLGPTASFAQEEFISCDSIIEKYGLKKIPNQDPSSTAVLYETASGMGKIGFIEPLSHAFCSSCNRMRLTADGFLKPCLHSDRLVDLKTPLRRGEDIRGYIEEALKIKPKDHDLLGEKFIGESMNRIGG